MSENEQAAKAEAPIFHVVKLYLKDLSFESPNAPESFSVESEPKAEFNLDTKATQKDDDHYEVSLEVNVKVASGDGKILFMAEVSYGGLFMVKNVPSEHIPMVLGIDCPNILFPYVRQVISSVVLEGGYKPMVLDPINFAALFHHAQQQKAAQQGEKA
ncbi:protein translocase subunit secB [Magnetococcus marinus MC-1]|uniref:Protein-export protein SecB n=1 Tax=Magnetococcus marinus (strain ATCC BAA-1437 / JCM 17883 / MC-1) TaxID=156889 RepID=SECB_MAGMM|nr:protein-export chaperone SecB [Magnetococcus marinus]A0LD65.1 RecName: Full=Protein-export protein SecB [Magnetococcus marinus MC-1]ABK45908.1 protein translocase subunit secB [Magnetococcus marinus MC-1]